jgi:ribonuclease PH
MFEGCALLDLDYQEDSGCETDMNLVMTAAGHFVEIQGTAEGAPFSSEHLQAMLALGKKGTQELMRLQALALQG